MRTAMCWVRLLAAVVIMGETARAAEDVSAAAPLMVAAEIEPGVGLDAEDVRRVIAEELHREVVAPAAAPGVDAPNVLLVSVDRARIVVSFRAPSEEHASRAIPTPSDRAGRLRAVAWLAGNLARDQVSPLVLAAAQAATTPTDAPPVVAPSPKSTVVAPPAAVAPPVEAIAVPARADELALRATPAPRSSDDPTWTVTASGGPSVDYWSLRHPDAPRASGADLLQSAWQLEVQRHRLGGWLLGGTIDYGPDVEHGFGLAVIGGVEQRWRGFHLEESLGVGIESALVHSRMTMVTDSSVGGESSQTTLVTSIGSAPYARLFATVSHPVWHAWDVVARIGAHTTLQDTADDTFFVASLGLRLRLP